jgi:hypothetical protein
MVAYEQPFKEATMCTLYVTIWTIFLLCLDCTTDNLFKNFKRFIAYFPFRHLLQKQCTFIWK